MSLTRASLKSTQERYGAIARLLHWLIALLIMVLLASGLLADDLPKDVNLPIHKALGIIVLALSLIRLAWWVIDRIRPHDSDGDIRTKVALGVKVALAGLGVVLPISGWLMSSAAGKAITIFGLVTVPPLLDPNKGLAHLFKESHEMIGNVVLALLALHIAGALYHHFVLKDDVMIRMSPHAKKLTA